MRKIFVISLVSGLFLLIFSSVSLAEKQITNQMIYQKLLDLEKGQIAIKVELREFKEATNRRFGDINKRFEDINKRFEDINRRFEDINKRFEDMNRRFCDINLRIDELRADMNARFHQIDKRFEQVDKRFAQMMNFLWILTGIFTTLTAAVIGFAYWDRRTIIRKSREETVQYLENEGKLKVLIEVLKEKAKKDVEIRDILKQFNLF